MLAMRFAPLAIVLIAVALSIVLYPRLPDPMPVALLLPLIMAGTAGLFAALPHEGNASAFRVVTLSTLAFLLGDHIMMLLMARGTRLNAIFIMTALVGALFLVLGTSMSGMRRNFIIGIRTPWTLASDDVWDRTHRLGGRIFMIAGALLMIAPFGGLKAVAIAFPTIAIGAALIPSVYSYVISRRGI
jgi:uncharacterized membrane protein